MSDDDKVYGEWDGLPTLNGPTLTGAWRRAEEVELWMRRCDTLQQEIERLRDREMETDRKWALRYLDSEARLTRAEERIREQDSIIAMCTPPIKHSDL